MTELRLACIVACRCARGERRVQTIAIGIFCKTPTAGSSKTRLSPPLRPEECAALSACFIRDLAATIHDLTPRGDVTGYAVLHAGRDRGARCARCCRRVSACCSQCEGDFGTRLLDRDARPARDATPARSWSMPTARPCRPRSCARPSTRRARRRRRAQSRARRRLYADRRVAAARAALRRHSVEHLRGPSQDRRARRRDRPAGRERARLVRRRRCSLARAAEGGTRRRAAGLRATRRRRATRPRRARIWRRATRRCAPDRRGDGGSRIRRRVGAIVALIQLCRRRLRPAGLRGRGAVDRAQLRLSRCSSRRWRPRA